MIDRSASEPPVSPTADPRAVPAVVAEALNRLRYGDIRLTVHDGQLVQIDVTEKIRITEA